MRRLFFTRAAIVVSATSILGYACGDSTSPVEQVPASITLIPSEVAINALGDTETLTATVRDALGSTIDTTVQFASSNDQVFTVDASGVITAIGIGTGQATASVGSLSRSSEVIITQVGTEIAKVSGDEQSAVVATALSEPVVVRVSDALGNGVGGLAVDFTVVDGGGTVSAASDTTGTDGSASTAWTLGTGSGPIHQLTAVAGGVGRTEFTATGIPDAPVAAAITAGNGQIQPIGAVLPIALTVTVTDQFGNGVPGQDALFAVGSGGGAVTPASAPSDSAGDVRAQWTLGPTLGAQTLEANVPGITSSPLAFFAEGTDLTVTGLSPDTLVEGQVARVVGTGFDTVTTDITISVDGAVAQITAATTTTIDFVVPRTPCRPTRTVAVVVTTAKGGTAVPDPPLTTPLAPGEFVALSVGEQAIVQDPSLFCFQFDAEASDQTYLMGVQSTNASGSELTVATVRGEVVGGATALPSDWSALQAAPARTQPYPLDRVRQQRWRLHREAEVALRAFQRDALRSIRQSPAGAPRPSASDPIPRTVQVGDAVSLNLPAFLSGDLCSGFSTISGLVTAVGTRGIWVADVTNPADGYSNADYQLLSDMLDTVIFDADTAMFGAPTDLDDNDRVIILVTKGINEVNPFVLGFVSPSDMFTTQRCEASNVAEIYYSKAPDPRGTLGANPYTRDRAFEDAPPLIAHELTHVIQAGRRLVVNDVVFMSPAVAEGQATLAEEIVGHAALGNSPKQNYGFSIALDPNDLAPNDWYSVAFSDIARYFGDNSSAPDDPIDGAPHECSWLGRDPFPCEGTGARPLWYGVTWSLLRWVNDHLGPGFPGGGPDIQKALVDNDKVGLVNLTNVLGVSIDSVLAQWSAALYLDDRISGLSTRLTFPSWNLLSIFERGGLASSAQLEPEPVTFSEFLRRVDVMSASTAYFLVSGANRPATAVRVRSATDEELPAEMQVYLVRVR